MNVFPRDPRLDHRLNAPCPECGCPQWLHTDRCLAKRAVKPSRGRRAAVVTGCQCAQTADDFALKHPHEMYGPVQKWGYIGRGQP